MSRNKEERPSVIARNYVEAARAAARERGAAFVELVSGEIHKDLQWKSRLPLVCNAMRDAMREYDEIIHTTPSGKSSTITIRYYADAPRVVMPQFQEVQVISEEKAEPVKAGCCQFMQRYFWPMLCVLAGMFGVLAGWLFFSKRGDA